MRNLQPGDGPLDRGRARRQQLLAAATDCFRRYGFHDATISLISKHADMSVGQIYHYFVNKEAIIAACVEQELDIVCARYDEFERADDVAQAILDGSPMGFEPRLDSALMMEVHAEAGRNPLIATLMAEIDQRLRARVKQLISRADMQRGRTTAPELDVRAEVLLALQIGVHLRLSVNAGIDQTKLKEALRGPLLAILDGKDIVLPKSLSAE